MNPYNLQAACDQVVIPSTLLKVSSAKTSFENIDLPTSVGYWVLSVGTPELINLLLPLIELSDRWHSSDTLGNMYVELLDEYGEFSIAPSKVFVRYNQTTNKLLVSIPWSASTSPVTDMSLRIRETPLYTETQTVELISGVILNQGPVFSISSDDLILIDGAAVVRSSNSIPPDVQNALCTLHKNVYRMGGLYDTVGDIPTFPDIDGTSWQIFDPARTVHHEVLPLAACSFYVAHFENDELSLGVGIPLTYVKQLTPSAFAIDAMFLQNYIDQHDASRYWISCVINKDVLDHKIDPMYDPTWVTALTKLPAPMRFEQYDGVAADQVDLWKACNLIQDSVVKAVGTMSRPSSGTPIPDQLKNPFYDKPYVTRFETARWRDTQDQDGSPEQLFNSPQPYPTFMAIFKDGVKLSGDQVYQADKVRVTNTKLLEGGVTTEVFDATPAIDFSVVIDLETGDGVVSLPDNPIFEVYRVEQLVEPIVSPSLCKDVPYSIRYIPIELSTVGEHDVHAKTCTFTQSGVYYFKYKQGLFHDTYDVDRMLKNNMPIFFSTAGLVNQRFGYSTIVYFNGRELVKGVEYVEWQASDDDGIYGVEIYITGMDHLLISGNVIEIIYQNNMEMSVSHDVLLPNSLVMDYTPPKYHTQCTIGGVSSRRALDVDGEINSDKFGELIQIRSMFHTGELGNAVELAILTEVRAKVNAACRVFTGGAVVPVENHPKVVSFYQQRLIGDAVVHQAKGTLSELDTQEKIDGWHLGRGGYARVDAVIQAAKEYNYLEIVNGCLNPEELHPSIHDVVNGRPYQGT